MEKRNTLLLTVIAIATLMVAITGAAFAYFAAQVNINNSLNVDVETTGGKAIFTATSSGEIAIGVESYMMQEHDADNSNTNTSNNAEIAPLLTNNATINVTLQSSEAGKETTCTYDVVYKWNETASGSNFTEEYSKASSNGTVHPSKYYVRSENGTTADFKELTITIESSTYSGEERPDTQTEQQEVNIDYFKDSEGKITLLQGQTIGSDKTDDTNHIVYDFTFKFYNLSIDQTKLMDKKFSGTISVENVQC